MKIKIAFLFTYLLISTNSYSQQVNPNDIRNKIYNKILEDISKDANIEKKIVLDPTINKFNNYRINEFEIKLDSVQYDQNLNFCSKTSSYKCVSKFEIDNYTIKDVFKKNKEEVFPVFYGIYAPLDTWYNVVYHAVLKHFEKNSSFQFSVLIPVRNVWIKDKKMKEKIIFYKFWFDEKFEVLQPSKTIIE